MVPRISLCWGSPVLHFFPLHQVYLQYTGASEDDEDPTIALAAQQTLLFDASVTELRTLASSLPFLLNPQPGQSWEYQAIMLSEGGGGGGGGGSVGAIIPPFEVKNLLGLVSLLITPIAHPPPPPFGSEHFFFCTPFSKSFVRAWKEWKDNQKQSENSLV